MEYLLAAASVGPLLSVRGRYMRRRRVAPRQFETASPRDGVAGDGPRRGRLAAPARRAPRAGWSRRTAPNPRKMPALLVQTPHRFARFARRVCASGGAMPK
ncbi:hypothetical protein WT97_00295 [Burkholderia sp. MSMB1459WGS]|uniref:hypothetical protein n=1 Tax=Burkholderia sp. MSMB1459WGS TaxID=1637970 RepID=UPI00075FE35E|nr:hypothetical protein [Burkholderia sp. MSMB1459WGS]KWO44211.1 hypothetical protein WT97_00295 [Burkholderia sp. MSMB1459WGS]